jgi:hypothetical protein
MQNYNKLFLYSLFFNFSIFMLLKSKSNIALNLCFQGVTTGMIYRVTTLPITFAKMLLSTTLADHVRNINLYYRIKLNIVKLNLT